MANFVDAPTQNEFLDRLNSSTSCALSTEGGLDGHPASLAPLGKVLAFEQGTSARIYSSGRSALAAAYTERENMQRAVTAMTMIGKRHLNDKGQVTNVGIDPARRAELESAMSTAFSRAASRIDIHQKTIVEAITTLKKQIDQSLVPRSDTPRSAAAATEIRSYVARLKPEERVAFVVRAIKDADHEVASAVLSTTPFVSGLSREDHALIQRQAQQAFAPQAFAQHDAALQVLNSVDQAGSKLISTYKDLLPAPARVDASTAALQRLKDGA